MPEGWAVTSQCHLKEPINSREGANNHQDWSITHQKDLNTTTRIKHLSSVHFVQYDVAPSARGRDHMAAADKRNLGIRNQRGRKQGVCFAAD